MLPWQPILGTIGKMTFIWQAGIPEWLGIWQFQFQNIQLQYYSYIVCKYDQDWSSNPRDYKVTIAPFWRSWQKSAYPAEYLGNY